MALFNKEADKNNPQEAAKPEAKPATIDAQWNPQQRLSPAVSPSESSSKPAMRSNGPAVTSGPNDGRAFLDRSCKVVGKLSFEGPARIDGTVEGEIAANDLIIGETAVITAQIKSQSVVVAGKLSGDIHAGKRCEIRAQAKVLGNITSPILVVHEGALFEGHCAMQSAEGAREKVTILPKEERLASGGTKPA